MQKKVPSFTILELIMTLLITSVVSGIVYFAWLKMNAQFIAFQKKSLLINEYLLFRRAFNLDTERSLAIKSAGDKKRLLFYRTDSSQIEYIFRPEGVTRLQEHAVDSFRIKIENVSLKTVAENFPLVKQISIQAILNETSFDIIFIKHYSAMELMAPPFSHE